MLCFRFYSSTEYFSVPPQLTGDWHDLSLYSWGLVEDSLGERFDSVLAAVRRRTPEACLVGCKSQAAALCKVLEEVSALYSWDRPVLHSPVKKGRKSDQKLGNSVVVVTRLPADTAQLGQFMGLTGVGKKRPTVREVLDSCTSKKVKSHFLGELDISLHVLDTGEGGHRREVVQIFNKALKEFKGGVLPLSSLSTPYTTQTETGNKYSWLRCSSTSGQSLPSSAVMQSHLAETVVSSKKSYFQEEVKVGNGFVGMEFVKCDEDFSGLQSRGFIRNTFFKPGQKWKETLTVWSSINLANFGAIMLYLQHSGQCLILENKEYMMAVMFYQADTSATLCTMDKVESHFYHLLLSLETFTPTVTLTEEINTLFDDIKTLQFSPSKESVLPTKPTTSQFDVSTLNNWRLPDLPTTQVLSSLKTANYSLTSQNSTYHKLMIQVRESYTSRGVVMEEKMKSDSEAWAVPKYRQEGGENAEPVQGDVFMHSDERIRHSVTDEIVSKNETVDTVTFMKESVPGAKAKAAADILGKMGDPHVDTNDIFDIIASLQNSVVTCTDDIILAGFAEACVSVLLKHFDSVGVDKASLVEVFATKLLLHVSAVVKLFSADPKLRVGQHKLQVLLRAEAHWLLASQTEQQQYEDSMLAHLRQISLYGGKSAMTGFLSAVLTVCYVDKLPELLCLLYDKLDQERPQQLAMQHRGVGSISETANGLIRRKSGGNLSIEENTEVVKGDPSLDSDTSDSFEFAGHSSSSDLNYASFEFAGDSSNDQDERFSDTALIVEEAKINFFAGQSDDSVSSIDLFEPANEIRELGDQYDFNSDDEDNLGPYQHLTSRCNNKSEDIDFSDPVQLTKPESNLCSQYCENKCSKLNMCVSFICEKGSIRAKFDALNRQERRNNLLDQLSHQDQFGLPVNVFYVKSEPLCVKFFSSVSGVSARVLSSVIEDFSTGLHRYTHGLENTKKLSSQMMKFISWTVSFAKIHGEHRPDDYGVIALPSFLTKAKLYQYYSDSVGTKRLALSTFYQALGSKFGRQRDDVSLPCIVIPKDSEHCKCNECLSLKKFKRSAKTELQISVAEKLLQNHLDVCARERMQVWCLFQRCVDFKYENLGIQFDDMDQRKTNIPKFAERSKALQNFNQLKTHCTGVIVHSGLYPDNRSVQFYLNNDQFEQGGSKSVSIIHEVLKQHVTVHGFLPPHLHIRDLAYRSRM